jgi:hypothetical protein
MGTMVPPSRVLHCGDRVRVSMPAFTQAQTTLEARDRPVRLTSCEGVVQEPDPIKPTTVFVRLPCEDRYARSEKATSWEIQFDVNEVEPITD